MESSGHQCKLCGKEFSSSVALDQHRSRKHGPAPHFARPRQKKTYTKWILTLSIIGVVAIGIVFSVYGLGVGPSRGVGLPDSAHLHASVVVNIDGETLDFSQSKYQLQSGYVHLEGGRGDVLHVHATGVTLGYFLSTLGMSLTSSSLTLDTGETFSNEENKTVMLFVNGESNSAYENYEIRQDDRIRLSYGAP